MPYNPFAPTAAGPNPDPEKYILVRSREGDHYRKKRGLNKPAVLNNAYAQSRDSTRICSPAAKRMAQALHPYLSGLRTGRLQARMGGLLKKAWHRDGQLHFGFFAGYEFQKEYPLSQLLIALYTCDITDESVTVEIPIDKQTVKQYNQLVSGYYFDLVLLWGDALAESGLKTYSLTSPLYSFAAGETSCTLSLPLPLQSGPWMLMLKLSCLEGNELACHPKHYGMKVVGMGGG